MEQYHWNIHTSIALIFPISSRAVWTINSSTEIERFRLIPGTT